MEIKDLAGLSQPLTKLIDVVAQGIGILYEPKHIKRMAKARKDEIKTITSILSNSNLPIQYSNGPVSISTSTKKFIERTEKRMLFLEMQKQKNIEDIVSGAYENLESEQEVSEKPIQEEWINRFFNIVSEINTDELKVIWSKILSEEIKNPGKCSIRTLETLRNITKKEAEIFNKVSNYIIKYKNICYLPKENGLLESINVKLGEIIKLDEAQLINLAPKVNVVLNFDEDNKENYLLYNNIIIFCQQEKNCEIKLRAYPITGVGIEIFNILSPTIDEVFFEKYLYILKDRMNISYSKILEVFPDGQIQYETPKIQISAKKE